MSAFSKQNLPDRVLYVGSKGKLRLVIPARLEDIQGSGKYAALSYRWGQSGRLLLKNDNLAAFQRGEFPTPLPRTFQDAITVCKGLGIDYLWIDALCIIQDQPEIEGSDWKKQAPKMGDVYSHAYITIAAEAAPDHDAGFLDVKRKASLQAISEITLPGPDHAGNVICLRPIRYDTSIEGFVCHQNHGNHTTQSYLYDRGWTMQETLLSPHVLHFGPDEVSWQCATGFACECARWAVSSHWEEGYATPPIGMTGTDKGLHIRPKDLHNNWMRILELFSTRKLTNPRDRLFALAGLARRAQKSRPGVRYYAGVWEDEFKKIMLWRSAWYRRTKRIEPPIAPSWSWASVDGEIWCSRNEATDLGKIEIDSSEVPEEEQYGSVPQEKPIRLTMTGCVFHIRAVQFQPLHVKIGRGAFANGSCILHFNILPSMKAHVQDKTDLKTAAGVFHADTIRDFEFVASGQDVTLLNCQSFTTFLVLAKSQSSDCLYRRVGLLVKSREDLPSWQLRVSRGLPDLEYLQRDPDNSLLCELWRNLSNKIVPGPLGWIVPPTLFEPISEALGSRATISIC